MTHLVYLTSSDECRLFCQKHYKEQQNYDILKTCCLEAEIIDEQLYLKDGSDRKWNDSKDDTTTTKEVEDIDDKTNVKVSDVLHELAESLPFTGCIVNVYLDIPEEFNSSNEGFLSLYGSIRRLKDWHNAAVIYLSKGQKMDTSDPTTPEHELIDLIPGIQVHDISDALVSVKIIWRGKISVVDKTVNRGFILPGLEMHYKSDDHECSITHPNSQDDDNDVVLGRMLEVLDEVDVETIPDYLLTSNTFNLSQQYHHAHASVFMDHIRSCQSGILMRLCCYHGDVLDVKCSDKYLNTSYWKESIMADITFIQEPEEELLLGYEFLHFVAYCTDNQEIVLHQLWSPHQLNGKMFEIIYHNSLLPLKKEEVDDTLNFLSELPVFSPDSWEEMWTCLKDLQTKLLQDWIDKKVKDDQSTVVRLSDLHAFLYEVQKTFLEQLKSHLPEWDVSEHSNTYPPLHSELDKSPSSWTERCCLVYQESQRKSFNRLQSTDSMALSSPVQSEDMPATIDMAGFLKLFQQDGNPAALKLSPVRKRHPSRSFRLQDSSDIQKTTWLDCHYLPQFDIYYNIGKKTEKQESQNYKLREKHIKAETTTSGHTTVFKLPKKRSSDQLNKSDQVVGKSEALCLRRSPRKSVGNKLTPPRKTAKGNLFSPRKSAGRGLLSPRKPLKKSVLMSPRKGVTKAKHMLSPTRHSPRKRLKVDLNSSLPGTSFNKPSSTVDKFMHAEISKAKRRHSVGDVQGKKTHGSVQSRKSLVSANDSLNTSSASGLDDSLNTQRQKESRSERHKRRLEEIVDNVLKQHGVDKNSPIYKSCSTKLFKVTKLFVMDLPTSQNLKEEMKNIAESQAQQVITLERRRQSIGTSKKQ